MHVCDRIIHRVRSVTREYYQIKLHVHAIYSIQNLITIAGFVQDMKEEKLIVFSRIFSSFAARSQLESPQIKGKNQVFFACNFLSTTWWFQLQTQSLEFQNYTQISIPMYSSAVLGLWTFCRIASPYSFLLRTTVLSDGVDWSLTYRVVPHLNGRTDMSREGRKNFIGLTNESSSPTQNNSFQFSQSCSNTRRT